MVKLPEVFVQPEMPPETKVNAPVELPSVVAEPAPVEYECMPLIAVPNVILPVTEKLPISSEFPETFRVTILASLVLK